MNTARRIECLDRRWAAIHEAGHLVMARSCGFDASARIWKVEDSSDSMSDATWTGQTLVQKSYPERVMIGLAGPIAEYIWKGIEFDDIDWNDPATMSPTDWDMCGRLPGNLGRSVLRQAESLYFDLAERGQLWKCIVRESRRLIEDAKRLAPVA